MKTAGERHDKSDFFIYMGYVIHTKTFTLRVMVIIF